MIRSRLHGALSGLALAAGLAHADERILDFHSDIAIAADASMDVTETIRVRGEGDRIRHGIYRDFPTDYRDRAGNRVHVDFEPVGLTRDGHDEPFHTEQQGNGIRVYFGSSDSVLTPGDYAYELHYRATRELGFFEDHDELYWNVTGNGWEFPIDAASAAITLPGDIATAELRVEGYTGIRGSKAQNHVAKADAPSHALIRTTRVLAPSEGLTVVVGFPKGVVAPPAAAERATWFLRDNGGVLVGGAGLLLMWAYYLVQWFRVGRDPKPGVIVAQYTAPDGFTPGALRHIERMGYDNRCFAADVVDMGVRGALRIEQDGSDYQLQRTRGANADVLPLEVELLKSLFAESEVLELKQSEHTRIAAALKAHKASLDKSGIGRYFNTHGRLVIPGALLGAGALIAGLLVRGVSPALAGGGFALVWLGVWSFGVIALVGQAIAAWRAPPSIAGYGSALFLSLFSLPFVAGEVVGIGVFVSMTGVAFSIVAAALFVTNFAFFHWLKAPTLEGRTLLDHIAGLRLYLGVAERDELAAQKAPPLTSDEFQRFLPYALALGVEKTWADRFAAAVGPAAAAAAAGAIGWYQGSGNISSLGSFTDSLGSSLSGAISSSSSAPGSSSGGGGGGSSGGGGGGGGGGGW
ncbi:MAG TPA: DUF2207 domain-containing protein [Dokdonella sp.]